MTKHVPDIACVHCDKRHPVGEPCKAQQEAIDKLEADERGWDEQFHDWSGVLR